MSTPVKVIATRLDKNRGNVCVSRRAVLEKSKNAEISEALKNIKENDIIENAIVKATTDWGIFLDINGFPYPSLVAAVVTFPLICWKPLVISPIVFSCALYGCLKHFKIIRVKVNIF